MSSIVRTPTRRRSNPFSLRPPIRSKCGTCGYPLDGPLADCPRCARPVAGVRWRRLLFQVTLLATVALLVTLLLRDGR